MEESAAEPQYRLERYRPELRSRLLDLHVHLWSTDRDTNDRYFRWKFEENPYLDDILIYVVMAGDQVVGAIGAYGVDWVDSTGAPFSSLCASDLTVLPQHRGLGLAQRVFLAMTDDLGARGYRHQMMTSAAPITHRITLRQGWDLVTEHRFAHRRSQPTLPARFAARVKRRTGIGVPPGVIEAIDRASSSRLRRPRAISIESAPRSTEMAELCARAASPPGSVRHARDGRFLEWRFRSPLARYRFLYRHESRTLTAYLVIQQHVANLGRIALVDWAFVSAEQFAELVRVAVEDAAPLPAVVALGGRSEAERSILLRAGFVERKIPEGDPYRPGLFVKRLAPAAPGGVGEPAPFGDMRWSYHLIDGDGF